MNADDVANSPRITSIDELESRYGTPSRGALIKEIDYISDHYRAFIASAPFVVIATSGPAGLDCSPRGDPPGFCHVVDSKTVLIPDRRGNNRLDTLRNLVTDPRVSLLFLIPGIGETLRIVGHADLLTSPEICGRFAVNGKLPCTVMSVTVDSVYFQCQKALRRSRLWDVDAQVSRQDLPSTGTMLHALSNGDIDASAYDDDYPQRLKETLY